MINAIWVRMPEQSDSLELESESYDMTKIVISGGPHAGKTTLFNALKSNFEGRAAFIEEPASAVITKLGSTIIGNSEEFCRQCIQLSRVSEQAALNRSSVVIQDRSLVDTIAYARRDGCNGLLPELETLVKLADYTKVLFCEQVGVYSTSYGRYEDEKTAQKTHDMLLTAYEDMHIPIVGIPAATLDDRIKLSSYIIEECLNR